MELSYKNCNICPRGCGIDREVAVGACRAGAKPIISRVSRHMYEEPAICGKGGAGTVFFSGCNLGCVFCQNSVISRRSVGKEFDEKELSDLFLTVAKSGVSSLDLVTPTHFSRELAGVLREARGRISIPIVYNSSGYESVESLRELSGLVDVYLPDLKYFDSGLSAKYSQAADYFEVARAAIGEMYSQVGEVVIEDGLIKRGVIVRHLVLPGCRRDSMAILGELAEFLPVDKIKLSLMWQYTPEFLDGERYPELARRITTFEYNSVLKRASELGFDGFIQSAESATSAYTPNFNSDDAFLV